MTGGSAHVGAPDTTACFTCHGSGRLPDHRVKDGPRWRGQTLPRLLVAFCYLVAIGVGVMAYSQFDEGGYDAMVTSALIGLFTLVLLVALLKALFNPTKAVVILAVIWGVDHFLLGGVLVNYLRDSILPWLSEAWSGVSAPR